MWKDTTCTGNCWGEIDLDLVSSFSELYLEREEKKKILLHDRLGLPSFLSLFFLLPILV